MKIFMSNFSNCSRNCFSYTQIDAGKVREKYDIVNILLQVTCMVLKEYVIAYLWSWIYWKLQFGFLSVINAQSFH